MSLLNPARRRPVITETGQQRRHRPDYILLLLSVILLVVGLIVVYAISPGLAAQKNVSENYYVGKQFIAIGLGIVTFGLASTLAPRFWRKLEVPMLIAAGLAALAVLVFGEEVNGAQRWIQIGGMSFQAAELIKFALVVWLAGFLADRMRADTLANWKPTLKPLCIVLLIIGVVVAWLESDLGSAAVMVAIMASMAFVAGMPLKRVMMIIGVIAIGTTLAIGGSSYRRSRVQSFLQPTKDCQSTSYQACQALIAVGSGGIFGLGLGHSVQAYGYLPEAANDSIFAIYAEKFGFIGSVLLIGLFVGIFARLLKVIERAPDSHSRLLVTGVLAWLSTQTIINVGAMVGLLPLKGITLPFISYGGTSLIFVTAAIGLAYGVSRYTTYAVNDKPETERAGDESRFGRRGERGAYYAASGRRA